MRSALTQEGRSQRGKLKEEILLLSLSALFLRGSVNKHRGGYVSPVKQETRSLGPSKVNCSPSNFTVPKRPVADRT